MSGHGVTEEWRSHQRDCKETVLSVGYLLQQQQMETFVFCFIHIEPWSQIVRRNFAESLLLLNKLLRLILVLVICVNSLFVVFSIRWAWNSYIEEVFFSIYPVRYTKVRRLQVKLHHFTHFSLNKVIKSGLMASLAHLFEQKIMTLYFSWGWITNLNEEFKKLQVHYWVNKEYWVVL